MQTCKSCSSELSDGKKCRTCSSKSLGRWVLWVLYFFITLPFVLAVPWLGAIMWLLGVWVMNPASDKQGASDRLKSAGDHKYRLGFSVFTVLLALVGYGANVGGVPEATKTVTPTETQRQYTDEELAAFVAEYGTPAGDERHLEDLLEASFRIAVTTAFADVEGLEVDILEYDVGQGQKSVNMVYRIGDYTARFNALASIAVILEKLPDDLPEEINKATFTIQQQLVDSYGNKEYQNVINTVVTRDTWERINYENFNYNKIPTIAEVYWDHPAIRD